jgi:hypothetical protein
LASKFGFTELDVLFPGLPATGEVFAAISPT